ncbi:hypothetical protein [Flavobacterium nackdongense]|uniref:Uncharacterized protein n=1 Tax=Flavobacterium nackdongense TaxID=2547394 RepID=A0A4P6Y6E5_9FLAO|nr:hypothetical protein [Flavobacterium nackdongense]QBN17931.1 hypothetical protein E1750_03640 [Flavobacterium nackdongense]
MKTFKLDTDSKIKSGFTTPDTYFEDFSAKIMQQLPEKEPKIISIFARRKTWLYAAAAILILALAIPMYLTFNTHSSEIDDETMENYLTYHARVSDVDLVNLLDSDDIQNMNIDMNIEDKTLENELSHNRNLEQYILN